MNLASVGTATAQFPSHWNVTGFASGKHPVHCQRVLGMASPQNIGCEKMSWKNRIAFFATGRELPKLLRTRNQGPKLASIAYVTVHRKAIP